MNIGIHLYQFGERGTETSSFDLGIALQEDGHRIEVLHPSNAPRQKSSYEMFRSNFDLRSYRDSSQERSKIGKHYDCIYLLKTNGRDGVIFPGAWNAVHVVFREFLPHGSSYVYVSDWLANHMKKSGLRNPLHWIRGATAKYNGCYNALRFDSVPHIVNMPKLVECNYRSRLGLSEEAFLVIRYGGFNEFDIKWAQSEILEFLERSQNAYFLAVNTKPFTSHKKVIYLDTIYDKQEKANILKSSNLFLHARALGETFGLSLVEAMQMGIDVLAYSGGNDQNQNTLFKSQSHTYETQLELRTLLDERYLRFCEGNKESIDSLKMVGEQFRPEVLLKDYYRILFSSRK